MQLRPDNWKEVQRMRGMLPRDVRLYMGRTRDNPTDAQNLCLAWIEYEPDRNKL